MLFYIYSDAPGSTIDITNRCRVDRPFTVTDNAEEGSVALSTLIVDDPDGDIEFTGHRRIYIYESEAPIGNQNVFNGFIASEEVSRGPYRTGPGRIWTLSLSDPNVLINRRIMNGTDANRPAENDLQRIQALLTMTELNTVDDDLYVSTTAATFPMDAVDYRGQNVGAYIDDCRQQSGKNGYIFYREAVGQYSLWYDFDYSDEYDSGVRLSNYLLEVNQTNVFEYSQERTTLTRDPSRIASGIYLDFDNKDDSPVYVQSPTTLARFAAIDWAAPSVNVKTLAKATARANRYLNDADSEQVVIHTVMTSVPRRSVNVVKKGQLVGFAGQHFPGFEANVVCRILNKKTIEISEDPEASFEIEMDLTPLPFVCPEATASQTFAALHHTDGDGFAYARNRDGGNLSYTVPGVSSPEIPDPAHIGAWNFPGWGTGTNPDYSGACVENGMRFVVVGDGTLTIPVVVGTSGNAHMEAEWRYRDALGAEIVVQTQLFMSGETVTFNISTDEMLHCVNWVDVHADTNFAQNCSGYRWGYDGDATWVLTV